MCKLGKRVTFFGISVFLLSIRVCPSGGYSYRYSISLLFSYAFCLLVGVFFFFLMQKYKKLLHTK